MCRLELIVDIGASNTVIYEKKRGIVLCEPSIVAIKNVNGKKSVFLAGNEALDLAKKKNRPDNVNFIYPVNNASVQNVEACKLMIKYFLEKFNKSFIRPTFVVYAVISCGLQPSERKIFENIFFDLNIKNVTLIDTPIAVLPKVGGVQFVMIAGASVTDIAIVGENGVIAGCSISISGSYIANCFKKYILDNYHLISPLARVEDAVKEISEMSLDHNLSTFIQGKDDVDRIRRKEEISSGDLQKILIPTINDLIQTTESIFRIAPENYQASIKNSGLHIYGGLANIPHLDTYMSNALGIPVYCDGNIEAVASNCSKFFKDKISLNKMLGINVGSKK